MGEGGVPLLLQPSQRDLRFCHTLGRNTLQGRGEMDILLLSQYYFYAIILLSYNPLDPLRLWILSHRLLPPSTLPSSKVTLNLWLLVQSFLLRANIIQGDLKTHTYIPM